MPKISPIHNAALDVIDFLHFHDVLTSVLIKPKQKKNCDTILSLVQNILSKHSITEQQAEIIEHYLLCGLEITLGKDEYHYQRLQDFYNQKMKASEEEFKKIEQYNIDFSLACLSNLAEINGVNRNLFATCMEQLTANDAIAQIPRVMCQRLVARCLGVRFPNSALLFYRQLIELEVMESKKYRAVYASSPVYAQRKTEYAFLRAGLTIEFEVLRNSIYDMMGLKQKKQLVIDLPKANITLEQRRSMVTYYKKIIDVSFGLSESSSFISFNTVKVSEKRDIEYFLLNVSSRLKRKRFFNGTQGRWLGTLGTLLVEKQKMETPSKAIYCESNNSGTVSENVCKMLKQQGFSISARNLYLRHKAFKEKQYQQIKYYSQCTSNAVFACSWIIEDQFYDMALNFDPYEEEVTVNK